MSILPPILIRPCSLLDWLWLGVESRSSRAFQGNVLQQRHVASVLLRNEHRTAICQLQPSRMAHSGRCELVFVYCKEFDRVIYSCCACDRVSFTYSAENVFKWVLAPPKAAGSSVSLYVVTGTWYDPNSKIQRFPSGLGIPDYFYKVI